MSSELCPSCGVVTNMRVDITDREVIGADGKAKKVTTRTFHCEACNSFVRSEDTDSQLDGLAGPMTTAAGESG